MPAVAEIIELANVRTERRAGGELNLTAEFWSMLSEFMKEKRFWWRRVSFTFNTVLDENEYDLDSQTIDAPDFDEMEALFVINPPTSTAGACGQQPKEIIPLTNPQDQVAAIENTVQGPPSGYFIQLGSYQKLMLAAPADAVYKLRGTYWAIPDLSFDSDAQEIPYIPRSLQWGLAIGLERNIFRYLYGQKDPRYITAMQRYEEFVEKAARAPEFTTKKQVSFSTGNSAVRATR